MHMAKQLQPGSRSGSKSAVCVWFDWVLACMECCLIPACLYTSTLAATNPFQTRLLLVALNLPLAACACLGAVYVPAVVLVLLVMTHTPA